MRKLITLGNRIPTVSSLLCITVMLLLSTEAAAQTTQFTYQGNLRDGGGPVNGSHDFQFRLFDTITVGTGTQHGPMVPRTLNVSGGSITVLLDFGSCATCFNGADRFLEISVKRTNDATFTILSPRQQITSTPYSLKTINATTADGLSLACVSCVTSTQIGSINASVINGTVPVASIPSGSNNYIQNNVVQQLSSNFNISGNGTAASFNSNGPISFAGTSAPSVAPANQGRIYFDLASNKLKISENGSTFVNLVGASGISGSGTTNTLPMWSAGTTLGDSLLTQSNNRIGIGTSSPATRLHIKGTAEVALRIEGDPSSPDMQLETSIGNVRRWTFGSTGNSHPTPNAFFIYQDTNRLNSSVASTRLLINDDGRVGVGTNAPNAKLYVEAAESFGIFGHNTANDSIGVFGQSLGANGNGVVGRYDGPASNSGWGVFGFSPNGFAGVFGSGNKNGVYGRTGSPSDSGVWGENTGSGVGVSGSSNTGDGVFGTSTRNGVHGRTGATNDSGVWGENIGNGWGVAGSTANGFAGVFGTGGQNGVYGQTASSNPGVSAVYGRNDGQGYGMFASSANGHGILGETANATKFGGYFRNTVPGGMALKVEGTASVGVLQITGGSDLAEKFDVDLSVKPGMVVAIDSKHGKLTLARGAYNRRVAGVISGAKNLSPGMVLPNVSKENKSLPVALSGRVWVYCDATRHSIKPGDLLTTSTTPGHAMLVSNYQKAQGATIGKAMSSLKNGKGMVLVLVTLQ